LISKGFDKGTPYYTSVEENPIVIRDATVLNWDKNHPPYYNLLNMDYEEISQEVLMEIEKYLKK